MVGRVSSDVKKGLRAERYLPLPTHPPSTPRAKVFIRIHHHEKGRKKGKRGNLEAHIALFCVTKKRLFKLIFVYVTHNALERCYDSLSN